MVNLNKKGISPVIATILLLAITVIIAVGVYQFLNTYTQDTFDSISGDSTVDLAFANQVRMYDSAGGSNVTVFIARTTYPEDISVNRLVFQRGESVINCDNLSKNTIDAGASNEFNFLINQSGATQCTGANFTPGKYDLLMIGNLTVSVTGIDFN